MAKVIAKLTAGPANTRQIVFGGMLASNGKTWLNDPNILIDGKGIDGLKPLKL